jgi:hypothetical protein
VTYGLSRYPVTELQVVDGRLEIGEAGSLGIAACMLEDVTRLEKVLNEYGPNAEIELWTWRGFVYEVPGLWEICSTWQPPDLLDQTK